MKNHVHARKLALPSYPRAVAKGKQIFIIDDKGLTTLINSDKNIEQTKETTNGLQRALQAISYVKLSLADKIDEIADDLIDFGVPTEYFDEIIWEGYLDVKKLLRELREQKSILLLK